MLEILNFIFQDIWHFLGAVLLIVLFGQVMVAIIAAGRGDSDDD